MNSVHIEREIRAPIDTVSGLTGDVSTWTHWMGISKVTIDRPADCGPLGLGTRYHARSGLVTDHYEVVAFDPPHRYEYELISGRPFRNYHGVATLTPTGQGTLIRWHVDFRPRLPGSGWALQLLIGRTFGRALKRLAELAEQQAR
jgi:uncharacterized protein YndB with AHSA1/START domain